ncbi:TylF/MycF/NovP-related O-methyltransferase [Amycolatopsis sp. NPDC059021]|uniref:TylF/MycF/NovP-related O-methyltransferase n=1 Tax=Amycolatopsis sp. NPDC059021 TaxID=3346704 RepID=UPI00366ECAE9
MNSEALARQDVRLSAGAEAYLDLIKRCLTRYSDGRVFLGPPLERPRTMTEIVEGRFAHQDADTMIGWPRLDNVRTCVETALRDGVPGDLIETGTWRGGACVFMRAILRAWDVRDRTVWLADSFAGFPEPDTERFPADEFFKTDTVKKYLDDLGYPIAIDLSEVEARFRQYGLLDEQVRFLPGYFSETLPNAPIPQLAVLRLDGDLYESTYAALEFLYPKLSAGGFCIIDDYSLETCRQAVGDYRHTHGIEEPIEEIDWTGVFWRKAGR